MTQHIQNFLPTRQQKFYFQKSQNQSVIFGSSITVLFQNQEIVKSSNTIFIEGEKMFNFLKHHEDQF